MPDSFQIHGITEKHQWKNLDGDHIRYRKLEGEAIVLALLAGGVRN
jgi:hypothetical protein